MILSDQTIINEPIKFLGTIRILYDKHNQVAGCYFSFNSRKMYYDTVEEAQTIRAEIIQNLPQAEMIKKELDKQWEMPNNVGSPRQDALAKKSVVDLET